MFHLIHGLPGAGKSKILEWVQSLWEIVWRYKQGDDFAFVAYSNSMVIDLFNKTKPPYNVSELNQKAACRAIRVAESTFQKNRTIVKKRWEETCNYLCNCTIM